MWSLKIFTVLLLANCVFAGSIFKRVCTAGTDHHDCLKKSFQDFFKDYSAGLPEKGIKTMDPITLDEVNVYEEKLQNMNSKFTNLKVTGLKNTIVTDLSEDKNLNLLHLTLKFNLVSEGVVSVSFLNKDPAGSGNIKYEGEATGHISYPVTTKTENDEIITELGEETIVCESSHTKATPSAELVATFQKDEDAKSIADSYESFRVDHEQKVVCEMAKAAFKAVGENIRALMRIDDR